MRPCENVFIQGFGIIVAVTLIGIAIAMPRYTFTPISRYPFILKSDAWTGETWLCGVDTQKVSMHTCYQNDGELMEEKEVLDVIDLDAVDAEIEKEAQRLWKH